jgi:hypothetical protein
MLDTNIWRAFRGIDLTYATVAEVQRVSFSEIILQESEEFRGICRREAELPSLLLSVLLIPIRDILI